MKKVTRLSALLCALCTLCAFLLASCGQKGETAFSYGKAVITGNMYSYWLSSGKSEFLRYYNKGRDSDAFWDTVLENGQTAEEYATELICARVKNYAVSIQLFRDMGLTISSETSQSIENDIAEKIEYYGSRDALNTYLGKMNINIDILHDIYIAEEKTQAVYNALYGSSGTEAVTGDELDAYYCANYSRIQYILVYTKSEYVRDADGNLVAGADGTYQVRELSAEEQAAKETAVQNILARLDAGEDFAAVKKDCDEYAFDTSYYANGFYVSSNELSIYGAPMVTAAADMKEGEYRRVDDTSVTYIMKKEPLTSLSSLTDSEKELLSNLSDYCTQEKYQQKMQSLYPDVAVFSDVISQYSIRTAYPNSLI